MSIKEKALERGLEEHKKLLNECREEVERLKSVLAMKDEVKPVVREKVEEVVVEEDLSFDIEDEQEEESE